uniref:Otopetrin n=1 Tax=Plectus sambesii TaxID=2011161 RepID=A0A914UJ15_9BILA
MIDSSSVRDYGYSSAETASILRKSGSAHGLKANAVTGLPPLPPPPTSAPIRFQLSEDPSEYTQRKKHCHWSVDTEEPVSAKISADMTVNSWAPSMDDVSVSASQTAERTTEAKDALIALLSALYALVLIIFALTTELSIVLRTEHQRDSPWIFECFHIYLYGAALAFFVYCYGFLLHRGWIRTIRQSEAALRTRLSQSRLGKTQHEVTRTVSQRKISLASVSYGGPTAGSLYLRLGCIVFGIVCVVSITLQLLKCLESDFFTGGGPLLSQCGLLWEIELWLSIIFTFTQMHFIFQNSKMTIHRSLNIGRFGTMHLVAVNLWVWMRHLIIEEFEVSKEIGHACTRNNTNSTQSTEEIIRQQRSVDAQSEEDAVLTHRHGTSQCSLNPELCIMRDTFAPMLNTCTIEYSLIAAGVMFVLWRNIGLPRPVKYTRRKHHLRVDCSSSTNGLFVGLIFLVATFISLIIFYTKIHADHDTDALLVFGITDSTLYLVSIVACLVGFWRTNNLSYDSEQQASGVKLLEDILLIVGLTGQLLFCISGIVDLGSKNHNQLSPPLLAVFIAHVMRLIQVLLQTIFILRTSRMAATTSIMQHQKPGREVVTFLMVVNMALFLVGTFEGQKSSVNQALIDYYGQRTWAFVAQSTVPLAIFYRFHSSVCLVEIWKHSYRVGEQYL